MSGAAAPAVEVTRLTKVYLPSPRWMRVFLRTQISQPIRALDEVSLSFARGQICVVAGPNGAGKTTLFKILTGLLAPTDGLASVVGIDATRESAELRRVVGFMAGDDRSLWLRLSCAQNLEFRGRLQGLNGNELQRRIDDVLDAVNLGDVRNNVGFALSAGMRARLQLACAMLHDPPVLILDEPTAAVDPLASFDLVERIRKLTTERNLAVLFSTHRVDEIEALGEKVVLLHKGKLVHSGAIGALRGNLERERVSIRFASQAAARRAIQLLDGAGDIEVMPLEGDLVTIETGTRIGQVLARLAETSSEITSVNEERLPLREVLAERLGHTPESGAS